MTYQKSTMASGYLQSVILEWSETFWPIMQYVERQPPLDQYMILLNMLQSFYPGFDFSKEQAKHLIKQISILELMKQTLLIPWCSQGQVTYNTV